MADNLGLDPMPQGLDCTGFHRVLRHVPFVLKSTRVPFVPGHRVGVLPPYEAHPDVYRVSSQGNGYPKQDKRAGLPHPGDRHTQHSAPLTS